MLKTRGLGQSPIHPDTYEHPPRCMHMHHPWHHAPRTTHRVIQTHLPVRIGMALVPCLLLFASGLVGGGVPVSGGLAGGGLGLVDGTEPSGQRGPGSVNSPGGVRCEMGTRLTEH